MFSRILIVIGSWVIVLRVVKMEQVFVFAGMLMMFQETLTAKKNPSIALKSPSISSFNTLTSHLPQGNSIHSKYFSFG